MKKIGTHDSVTGERVEWYSWFLLPFAKTQSKTIEEQYDAGCRLFDIRVKKWLGKWRLAHGWYISKLSPTMLFNFLNTKGDCHITITYEGGYEHKDAFVEYATEIKRAYPYIKYGGIAIKHGKNGIQTDYEYLIPADPGWIDGHSESCFVKLDGKSLYCLLPLPWLWKKLKYNHVKFDEEIWRYVDFL